MAALEPVLAAGHGTWFSPAPGIRMRYSGTPAISWARPRSKWKWSKQGKPATRILFSGDIGPDHKLLEALIPKRRRASTMSSVSRPMAAATVLNAPRTSAFRTLATELNEAAKRGGVMLIPVLCRGAHAGGGDRSHCRDGAQGLAPKCNIFIDSPLANKATACSANMPRIAGRWRGSGRAFNSPLVKSTESVEDSKALNRFKRLPHRRLGASGMARRAHPPSSAQPPVAALDHVSCWWVSRPRARWARMLEDGAKRVTIMGDEINVAPPSAASMITRAMPTDRNWCSG
jgi:metallo-beta-lactamase family protein